MAGEARILVIDDQPYFRRLTESLLGARHTVICADGCADAVRRLEAEGPCDLVVMDLMLADADGLETLTGLRRRWPSQAVVVLSSIGDPRAAVAAMRAGARDYLLKPVDCEALPAAVERVLEEDSHSPAEPPQASVHDAALLERAIGLLGLGDRAALEHELLEILCAGAGVHDGLLWRVVDGRYALAAVRGDLPGEGTAPQAPVLDAAAEAGLRRGDPWLEPGAAGQPVALHLGCVHSGSLQAIARLLHPLDGAFGAAALTACLRLAEIGAAALDRLNSGAPERESFRDPCSGLPGPAFLRELGRLEIHRAQRFGRRVSAICVEIGGLSDEESRRAMPAVVGVLQRALRSTEALAGEGRQRFWVLVGDADPLGAVVLKRRLYQRLHQALAELDLAASLSLGTATYPNDAEHFEALCARALARLRDEREGLAAALSIDEETPLAAIGTRLLERAIWLSDSFVAEAAELVIGDLSSRPQDRGLLFLAPGQDRRALLEPLAGLADAEMSTEIFIATDGETLPVGPAVTALGLPPDVGPENTWVVRFGEAPAYALIAGRRRSDGARPVFHTTDAGLVEQIAFRLRAEIGFGVRG